MSTGTKEFYELMEQFEKNMKNITYGHNVIRDTSGIKGVWYTDGHVNTIFDAYMHGYEYGKLTERLG
jgi:hypothetical protein